MLPLSTSSPLRAVPLAKLTQFRIRATVIVSRKRISEGSHIRVNGTAKLAVILKSEKNRSLLALWLTELFRLGS